MLDQAAMPQPHQPPPLPCLIFECHHRLEDESATTSSGLPQPAHLRVFTFCPKMTMCHGDDVAGVGIANCSANQVKLVIFCRCSHTHESLFTNQTVSHSQASSADDWADAWTLRASTEQQQQQKNPLDPEGSCKTLSASLFQGIEPDLAKDIERSLMKKRQDIQRRLTEKQMELAKQQQQQSESSYNSAVCITSAEETRSANNTTPQADIEKKYFVADFSTTRKALSMESPPLFASSSSASWRVKQKVPPLMEPSSVEFESTDIDDVMSCCTLSSSNKAACLPDPSSNATATRGASKSSENEAALALIENSFSHVAWWLVPLPELEENCEEHREHSTEQQGIVQQLFTMPPYHTLTDSSKAMSKEKPERDGISPSLKSPGGKMESDVAAEHASRLGDRSVSESCATDYSPNTLSADYLEPFKLSALTTTATDTKAATSSWSPPTADIIKQLEYGINAAHAGTAAETKQEEKELTQSQQQLTRLSIASAASHGSVSTLAARQAAATAADGGSTMSSMPLYVGSLDVLSGSSKRGPHTALAELRLQHQQHHNRGESDLIPASRSTMTSTSDQLALDSTRVQILQCCERSARSQDQSTVKSCQQVAFNPLLQVHQPAYHASCGIRQTIACVSIGAQLLSVTCPPRVYHCSKLSSKGKSRLPQQQRQHVKRPRLHQHSQHMTTGRHNIAAAAKDDVMINWKRLLVPDAVARLGGVYLGGGYLRQAPSQNSANSVPGQRRHSRLHHHNGVSNGESAAPSSAAAAHRDGNSEAAVHMAVLPDEAACYFVLTSSSETDA